MALKVMFAAPPPPTIVSEINDISSPPPPPPPPDTLSRPEAVPRFEASPLLLAVPRFVAVPRAAISLPSHSLDIFHVDFHFIDLQRQCRHVAADQLNLQAVYFPRHEVFPHLFHR